MSESDSNLVWKIAGGIVLGLLIFSGIEHYQQRKAVEAAMKEFQRIAADPDPLGWRAAAASRQKAPERATGPTVHPVPPGFRCMDGALLKQVAGGWMQVTSRHNEWYCPHGGVVEDCYRVSVASTGCR